MAQARSTNFEPAACYDVRGRCIYAHNSSLHNQGSLPLVSDANRVVLPMTFSL